MKSRKLNEDIFCGKFVFFSQTEDGNKIDISKENIMELSQNIRLRITRNASFFNLFKNSSYLWDPFYDQEQYQILKY